MDEAAFNAQLDEVRRRIADLPDEQKDFLGRLLEETRRRHIEMQGHLDRARSAIDDWRLAVRYLVFDLEATRRELEELRRKQGE